MRNNGYRYIVKQSPRKGAYRKGGSKYDKAIQTAIDNPNEWVEVASTTVENRSSMYSTASAIRGGRLGTIHRV